MIHLGDITKINGHNVPIVDIVTGGSPCQDLSVAGKRAGLEGERSGLFMEQIRIIKEMRDESIRQLRMRGADEPVRPRYMVWENVPGAFSSNKGEDFRCVLEETAKIADENAIIPRPESGKWSPSGCIMGNGWSIAWRVHDAQFWGVPQRRKRIALVADFGGDTAPKILFESESLSGNIEESGEEGQRVATTPERNIEETISIGVDSYNLTTTGSVSKTLQKEYSYNMSEQEPCQHSTTKVYCLQGNGIDRADTAGCNGKGWRENQSYTLNTIDRPAVLSIDEKMGQTYIGQEVGNTLGARDYKQPQAVCYGLDRASFNQGQNAQYDFSVTEEQAQTLVAKGPGGVLATNQAIVECKITGVASSLKQRDYKDATDLVIQNKNYPKQQGGEV